MNEINHKADLKKGHNTYLTYDIFDNSESAIRLDSAFLKFPPGVYFESSFTILFWIKLHSSSYDTRIMNFGNIVGFDNFDNVRVGIYFHQKVYFFINSNKFTKDLLIAKKV